MVRVDKNDFISPFLRTPAPGQELLGNGPRDMGFPAAIIARERRSTGTRVVRCGGDSRNIRKSRTAQRQSTGPYFRAIIAANDGSIFPFLGATSPGQRLRGNRAGNIALIRARKEGRRARR